MSYQVSLGSISLSSYYYIRPSQPVHGHFINPFCFSKLSKAYVIRHFLCTKWKQSVLVSIILCRFCSWSSVITLLQWTHSSSGIIALAYICASFKLDFYSAFCYTPSSFSSTTSTSLTSGLGVSTSFFDSFILLLFVMAFLSLLLKVGYLSNKL